MTEEQSKEGISLADRVSPDSTQTVEFTAPAPGTVESVSTRIYPGAELDLRLTPEIERAEGGTPAPLISRVGKEYLDGDDDKWHWEVSKPVNEGDKIRVTAENINPDYAFDYRVNIDVDYMSGVRRSIRSVIR